MVAFAGPDRVIVEHQLAGVTGMLDALAELGEIVAAEERAGQVATLGWWLGLRGETPATLVERPPSDDALLGEWAAAGQVILQPTSPGYPYAYGVYEALRWITGTRQEPLLDL